MKSILIIAFVMLSTMSFAQSKNVKASLEVDGVCGMCKTRIEKAAIKTKGVKSALWNIKTHELSLIFNEEKTSLDAISRSVAEAGHDNKQIKATDDAYNKVHPCCKYRDEEVIDEHK